MKDKKKAIISIAAGKEQVLLIKKAIKLGYAVIAVDKNPEAPGFLYSEEKLYKSTYDSKAIIEELEKLVNKWEFKGVFTRSSGPPVITTAIIADHFMLPGATEKAASTIVDKNKLMKLCQLSGIATPETQLIDEDSYLNLMAEQLPCIVKAGLCLVGKRGVRLVRKKDEIKLAFKSVKSASHTGEVLLEKFLTGIDAVLISLVAKGRVYPVTVLRELNEFDVNGNVVAKEVSMPYNPGEKRLKSIYDLAQSVVDITGIKDGPFLMSCKCSENSLPTLIEVHLDFGGDAIFDKLFPMSTNFDFIKHALQVILGISSPEIPKGIHFAHCKI